MNIKMPERINTRELQELRMNHLTGAAQLVSESLTRNVIKAERTKSHEQYFGKVSHGS